jgi:hypothetical protein
MYFIFMKSVLLELKKMVRSILKPIYIPYFPIISLILMNKYAFYIKINQYLSRLSPEQSAIQKKSLSWRHIRLRSAWDPLHRFLLKNVTHICQFLADTQLTWEIHTQGKDDISLKRESFLFSACWLYVALYGVSFLIF